MEVQIFKLASIVLALSILAGIASYMQYRRESGTKRNWLILTDEILSAVIAGLGLFFFGIWKAFPEPLTCLGALISASMGKAGIAFMQEKLKNALNGVFQGRIK